MKFRGQKCDAMKNTIPKSKFQGDAGLPSNCRFDLLKICIFRICKAAAEAEEALTAHRPNSIANRQIKEHYLATQAGAA